MQDADAEAAVGVDVGVPERAHELEVGGRVGVVGGELHDGFEVAAVVERVRVEGHEGDAPFEDVLVDEGDVRPAFFGQRFVLVHQHAFGHACCVGGGAEGRCVEVEGARVGVGVGAVGL